jgi:hypothetical protein
MDEIKNNMNICIYDEIDDILRYTKNNIFFKSREALKVGSSAVGGAHLAGGACRYLAP